MAFPATNDQQKKFREALDLLTIKLAEDEGALGVAFPYVTAPDGSWRTMFASHSAGYTGDGWTHGNWFCGFWVGLLLAAYLHSGDDKFRILAEERMHLVAQRANDPNTHDIGFIFQSSAVPAAHVTGKALYQEMALRAAAQLRARLVTTETSAYISSWGPLSDPRARRSSAIDTMANLPLLYWAAAHSGDASFLLAAEAHAKATRSAFVRPDMSTFHAVEYDEVTGARARGYTYQGFADDSCWSRGQAWAILGFTSTAHATANLKYLALAEQLAEYFFRRLGQDAVPYWDFDDSAIPDALRDSSTSAIVATALLDMAQMHPEPEKTHYWHKKSLFLLEGLCSDYLAREGTHRGLLKHGCYSKPHNDGPDSAVVFGDFYFVEALCKILMPGRFSPNFSGGLGEGTTR